MKDFVLEAIKTLPPLPKSVVEFNRYFEMHGTYMPSNTMKKIVQENEHDKKIVLEMANSSLYNFQDNIDLDRIFSLLGSISVKNILVADFISNNFKFDIFPRDSKGNKSQSSFKCICDLSPYGLDGESFLQECSKELHFLSSWLLEEDKRNHIFLPCLMLLRLGLIMFSQILIFNNLHKEFYEELIKRNFSDILEVEKKFLDIDHIEFLEFLLKYWHSQPVIIQSVHYLKTPHLAPQDMKKNAYMFHFIEKIFTPHNKVNETDVDESIKLMAKLKEQDIHFKIDIFIAKITKEYPYLPKFNTPPHF
ncbi:MULTISPECIES: HDOD domain-containing protein [unclassified Campylobacter]|uniref:HDOD domain-containing protein n=1 Tax=unclassified Campylobacter TaxID=2593542 RepID=UPI00224A6B00|nr:MULTISPECIES: hypothetical protein [unclassified Campylobacter]MCX2682742.1 hypothetical protein [Campylobacter sp. MIT 21-1684]MCX2751112.1 hypothetical protein [Campylobacter sp. MIT 21-1682]